MCFIVPLTITLIINGLKIAKKISISNLNRLNFLMLGGVTMLVVDHLWNGELFLIGPNVIKDLILGVVMSVAVLSIWIMMIVYEKKHSSVSVKS